MRAGRMAGLLVALAVPAGWAAPREPTLAEAQSAASLQAAGNPVDDASRTARVRTAHWAPVIRGQFGERADDRTRRGEFRLAPLREDDALASHTWSIMATWDLAQLVYAREESQLALAHVHLARVRREAAAMAARLWTERQQKQIALRGQKPGPERDAAALELLRITAELDAVTGGLYRELLEATEAGLAKVEGASLAKAEEARLAKAEGEK